MKKTVTHEVFKPIFKADSNSAQTQGVSDEDSDDVDDIDERGNLKDFIVDDDDEEYEPDAKDKEKGKGKKEKSKKEGKRRRRRKRTFSRTCLPNYARTSQTTSRRTGDIFVICVPLQHDLHLEYCRYDGGMPAKQRDEEIHDFTENPDTKVMLTSLKAGNAGLNLICATRVIILDPFWNPFIEKQAVDRTYRIGQRKPVEVHRILIKGTVEDRIMTLQEQKRELVEGAMDEEVSQNLSRLDQNALAYLFSVST
ncbi:uncharacterized protein PG986_014314 [Apiospora aurea]|uniref:Helicase C-terminal domain-containing protein n=1 Tax=Apiospora aurea TaxID=335848 RepID=A0ABR1PSM6_9PEZI